MPKSRTKPAKAAEKAAKKLAKLKKRGRSALIEVRDSVIHGSGVYAAADLAAADQIVEYVGELVDKKEGERRAWAQSAKAEKTGEAAVYIFNLSKKWDLDGSMEWNPARLINHSCDPNCEAFTEGKRIFVYALRDIAKGEELTFDYGFEAETYADHPCRCGSENCHGFIVGQDHLDEFRRLQKEAEKS